MPAYKDEKTGKWFAKFYYTNWQGIKKQKWKRGFATKKEALGFERDGETGRFKSESYRVWDVVPRNVLVDKDGDMYVIDAEIARNQ